MKWKRDSSELRDVWPYRVRENIVKMEVKAHLDGVAASPADIQKANWLPGHATGLRDADARWDIYLLETPWSEVSVQCSFEVDDPDGLKKSVQPLGQDTPFVFALLLRCDNTRWRKAVTCPFNEGSGIVSFSLSRADVAGDVELQPLVLLATSPPAPSAGWASRKVAKIATGFPAYLRLDEPPGGPGRGIEVKWQEFDDSRANALYSLEIEDDQKVRLLLNNRHPALQGVMDSESKARNEKTRLRDCLFSFIAGDVWLHLAGTASQFQPGEGEELPDLYDQILRVLSRRLEKDREDIKSYFDCANGELGQAELHTLLQNYLAVGEVTENLALEITPKVAGDD